MIDLSSLGLENPEEILRAIEKYKCEQSLLYFFERAWQEIDPAPLKVNWHHEGICLTGDSIILTEDGEKSIVDIVRRRWAGRVASFNHQKHCIEYKSVLRYWESPGNPVLILTTKFGRILRCTENHPIFIIGTGYVEAREVAVGARVMCALSGMVYSSEIRSQQILQPQMLSGSPHRRRARYAYPDMQTMRQGLLQVSFAPTGRFLQHAVLWLIKSKARNADLRKMWWPQKLGRKILSGMSRRGQACIERFSMCSVRKINSKITRKNRKAVRNVLQRFMFRYICPWFTEPGLYRWQSAGPVFSGVSGGSEISNQQRREPLFSVWRKKAFGCTPHRSKQGKQYSREFSDALPCLSQWAEGKSNGSRGEGNDIITSIEREVQIPEYVYNIEVSENNNYFSNGVLVHNCAHLEAVSRGEIRRIAINVPPRTSKTILVNVCYPAWTWIQEQDQDYPLIGAQVKFMCISYGQTLSTDIAVLARRLVLSDWYQRNWGDRVQLHNDQSRIDMFANHAGGFRLATSMSGATLGRGGSVRLIDDPQNVEDANSVTETEKVVRTYREALQTRETDPSTSAEIIIMQRLGADDLTGYILKNAEEAEIARKQRGEEIDEDDPSNLVHVMYPMLHDPNRHCTTRWYDDPRTEQDELLWPEQFPWSVVENYRQRLGPFGFSGQFQQFPVPRGGGIFQEDWFEAWPPLGPDGKLLEGYMANGRINYPAFEYVVACVDTAFTEKEENDPCAMIVLGIFRAEGKGRIEKRNDGTFVRVSDDYGFPKVMIVFAWEKHLTIHGPPQQVPAGVSEREWNGPEFLSERQKQWGLVEWVTHTCKRYKVDHLQIETQAAGHTLQQELQRQQQDQPWGVHVEVVPAQGTKVARAYAVQGIVSSHQIYVPTYIDGTYPSWCVPLMQQILTFPKTRYKDMTDTFTAALKHLRDIGILERREDWDKAEELSQLWTSNKPAQLPYDI